VATKVEAKPVAAPVTATKPVATQSLAGAIHTAAEAKSAPAAAEVKPTAPAAGSLFAQNENK